jgi:predicted GNAT family acetyltransferase
MQVIQHADAGEFAARVRNFLLSSECENCALLGLVDNLVAGRLHPPADPLRLMFTIESAGQVIGVAVQTRPESLLISRMNDDAIDALIQQLLAMDWTHGGCNGPAESSDGLAERWCAVAHRSRRLRRGLRVFKLTKVIKPKPSSGTMVKATPSHVDVVTSWRDAFSREIGEPDPDARRSVERIIREERLYIWEDQGQAVSMTGFAGPTPNGIRINQVYTPPESRGRGFASNLVAAVSQRLLDSGRTFCFLFTDLANPTSNKIYQQIGYQPEADFRHWVFE